MPDASPWDMTVLTCNDPWRTECRVDPRRGRGVCLRRTSVLITELILGITQLASRAVRPPWAVLASKRWRWPAGFPINSTTPSHSVPQKDLRLVLNDSTQKFHIAALVRITDSKLFALEDLREYPCQSLQGNKCATCSKIISPHSHKVSVNRMPKHH